MRVLVIRIPVDVPDETAFKRQIYRAIFSETRKVPAIKAGSKLRMRWEDEVES